MNGTNFARTGLLTRIGLKRDRLRLIIWIVFLAGFVTAVAAEFKDLYGTEKEINAILETLKGPAMASILGAFPWQGKITTADVFAGEMILFMAILQVIMNFSLAIHATRREEDEGMTEMIRARAVGKLAPLCGAVLELLLVNVLIGVLYAVGLSVSGMPGMDANGSWLFGLGLAAVGLSFGMLALVTAQLADNAAGATGLAYLLFGLAYLVRMMTDVNDPDYTWWSPLGWIEKLQVYGDNDWLPVLYLSLLALVLFILAAIANLQRDMGAGAISTRPGRRGASPILAGPATLLWRLERRSLLAWIVGMFAFGAMYGSVFNTIGDILKNNSTVQQLMGSAAVNDANHTIILNFMSLLVIIFAVLGSIPAVQIMNRLKGDEGRGLLEVVYAKPVSRVKQYFTYQLTGMVAGVCVFLAGIAGVVLMGNSMIEAGAERITGVEFWQTFLGQLPAVLMIVAVAAVLVGWLPRLTSLPWLLLAYGFMSLYMGNLLKLPKWAKQITPYGWVPKVPVKDVDWTTFWWMIALAGVLMTIGAIGYRRRDLDMR